MNRIFKSHICCNRPIRGVAMVLAFVVTMHGFAEQQSSSDANIDANVLNTIAYINQMNYAYVVMKTYHNPIAVQEQYERIALDKIDITSIPNYKYEGKSMKDLILDMQTKLKELSIADKDYAYYKECQEDARRHKKKMALLQS